LDLSGGNASLYRHNYMQGACEVVQQVHGLDLDLAPSSPLGCPLGHPFGHPLVIPLGLTMNRLDGEGDHRCRAGHRFWQWQRKGSISVSGSESWSDKWMEATAGEVILLAKVLGTGNVA
jgi:hypothetical protein